MRKVKQKRPVSGANHHRVPAHHRIIRTVPWLSQDRILLPGPFRCIIGAVNRTSFPDIDDHVVRAAPFPDVGTFAREVADGLAFICPAKEIRAIRCVNALSIGLIVVPKPPASIREAVHTGIDDAVARQRYLLDMAPVDEVIRDQLMYFTGSRPVIMDTRDEAKEHVVMAIRVDDLRGPVGVIRGADRKLDDSAVLPSASVVCGFRAAEVCSMDPGDAFEPGDVGAPVGVNHPPGASGVVPDNGWIRCAIVDGVAEQRLISGHRRLMSVHAPC